MATGADEGKGRTECSLYVANEAGMEVDGRAQNMDIEAASRSPCFGDDSGSRSLNMGPAVTFTYVPEAMEQAVQICYAESRMVDAIHRRYGPVKRYPQCHSLTWIQIRMQGRSLTKSEIACSSRRLKAFAPSLAPRRRLKSINQGIDAAAPAKCLHHRLSDLAQRSS